MRALVVYCHPRQGSFTEAVRDVVLEKLSEAQAEIRLVDLYARGFPPVLTAREHEWYEDESSNQTGVEGYVDDLTWCDTLIFVYPTWWYGLPALLKGWLDRTLVPGVAFKMPDDEHGDIRPGLTNITRLGVFTTCGASWWLTRVVGAPGRRTLMRGLRFILAKRCKTVFAAHYLMDASTPQSRARHLAKVARKMERFAAHTQCSEAVRA
ncbi:MAG: NAD(P)H dehydrogenase [Rhodobacteraceae bacterium]|nr:NAD(P)H dehydrogenase [Paracoccaceae bacterium]MAY45439.1 NAD(P)H dehydrogenase [Paracoccaceae bacterium]QEW22409.1 glutathione-regulated potassium-efflux system ancillary protein KefG [Marinibacterium anthonyi]